MRLVTILYGYPPMFTQRIHRTNVADRHSPQEGGSQGPVPT